MNKSNGNNTALIAFIIGLLLITTGIVMLVFDIVKVGRHYLTQQQGTIGGAVIILLGLLSVVVGYFNLSPFSKIRDFFEGGSKRRK